MIIESSFQRDGVEARKTERSAERKRRIAREITQGQIDAIESDGFFAASEEIDLTRMHPDIFREQTRHGRPFRFADTGFFPRIAPSRGRTFLVGNIGIIEGAIRLLHDIERRPMQDQLCDIELTPEQRQEFYSQPHLFGGKKHLLDEWCVVVNLKL